MADLKDVTFNVGISISNETVHRCCQLLEIYLQDSPDYNDVCFPYRYVKLDDESIKKVVDLIEREVSK